MIFTIVGPKLFMTTVLIRRKTKGLNKFTKNVGLDVGIGCYCEHGDNLLLWSHYGDSHKGIALGFDLPVGVFENPDDPTDRRIIIKVQYPESNNRKVIYWQDVIAPLKEEEHLQKVLEVGYAVKGWDWKYEQEYREFVFLDKCFPSGTLYFSKFLPGSLREVILGARCSLNPLFVRRLNNRVDPYREGPLVSRARSHPNSFKMIIENALP
jgi:Protein of unknown function (DUF2971)